MTVMQSQDPVLKCAKIAAVVSDGRLAEWLQTYCDDEALLKPTVQISDAPVDALATMMTVAETIVLQSDAEVTDVFIGDLCRLVQDVDKSRVILVLNTLEQNQIRQLFKAGVADVLSNPIADDELRAALAASLSQRVAARAGAGTKTGKLISVVKSAGGVGATQTAVNLARELRDLSDLKVALVDFDVQFGTLGLHLDVENRLNTNDAIRAAGRLDSALLKSLMVRHASGIDVLVAADTITPLEVMEEVALGKICEQLQADYDVIIAEYPAAMTASMHAGFSRSDAIVLVTDCSVRGAFGVGRLLKGFDDLEVDDPAYVLVLNKSRSDPEQETRKNRIRTMLPNALAAEVRLDRKLSERAADRGKCARDEHDGSDLAKDYALLARKLGKMVGVGAPPATEPPSSRETSLIGRLKSIGGRK